MKKLLIALILTQLSGCALWDIYNMSHFDNNEYGLITKVRTISQSTKTCDEVAIKNLYFTTMELKNYSQYVGGNNEQSIKMNEDLMKLVTEIYDREQPIPSFYCKAKLNIIEKSAERIQQVTGNKPQ
jgi:hypothetical protein